VVAKAIKNKTDQLEGACGRANGFELLTGTCLFPKLFAVLSRESSFFQHLKSMSFRAYICCLFVALHEDVPHVTNEFYFKIYTDISTPISIHDVCETGDGIIGTCFKHQHKERTS
jgi:hypothetical protein